MKLNSLQIDACCKLRRRKFADEVRFGRKQTVDNVLIGIFPEVLCAIINNYANPYSPYRHQVIISAWMIDGANDRIKYGMEQIPVSVPLRYDPRENDTYLLLYKDVFKAYTYLWNYPTNTGKWMQAIYCSKEQPRMSQLLKTCCTVKARPNKEGPVNETFVLKKGLQELLYFPAMSYWPLSVYWQNEKDVLTRDNLPHMQDIPLSTLSSSVAQACRMLLIAHNKISKDMKDRYLTIICSICLGKIEDPEATFLCLTKCKSPTQSSLYCTGHDSLCRTYRALRVFINS